MDIVTCFVQIAGHYTTKVFCDEARGVTYPELSVLAAIHGAGSITDVKVIKQVESSPQEEKGRLMVIYNPELVERLFPGLIPHMQMSMPTEAKSPAGKRPKEEI